MASRVKLLAMLMMLTVTTVGRVCAVPNDPKVGNPQEIYDRFVNEHASDDLQIWDRNLLLEPKLERDLQRIASIYNAVGTPEPPLKIYPASGIEALDYKRTGSLFSFMLRRNFDSYRHFIIPVVQRNDRGVVDETSHVMRNDSGLGAGESYLEYAIKAGSDGDYVFPGFIEQDLPDNEILSQGVYSKLNYGLPRNGSLYDPATWSLRSLPAFLGFETSYGDGIRSSLNPTTLDLHLYSDLYGRISENTLSPEELSCIATRSFTEENDVIFSGSHVENFLSRQEGVGEIKVKLSSNGRAYLNLRHTLLSDSTYVNYGMYTEPEMEVLRDLGYDIRPREFVGYTVFSNGTPTELRRVDVNSGYCYYSDRNGAYDLQRASEIPFGVGTHIMGDHNEVLQHADIVSVGLAGMGVRIDGSGNRYILPRDTAIIENGYDASGITVCNGHDTKLIVDGRVNAGGPGGIGINLHFGSNLLSDLEEYRGSHVRVRSLDQLEGRLSIDEAQKAPLPDELDGPLVSSLRINGRISGQDGAIFIGSLARVREISLEGNARLDGGIRSLWDPYFAHGTFMVSPEGTSHTLAGRLQLKHLPTLDEVSAQEYMRQHLHTKVIMGMKEVDGETLSDPRSRVEINGEINGTTLRLQSKGGHSVFNGSINVPSLEIANSVVSVNTGTSYSTVDRLIMDEHGVLNCVNGASDRLTIGKIEYISHGATIRVDAGVDGSIQEDLKFPGRVTVPSGTITIEPGLSYSDIKAFNANPREFMRFMERFIASARTIFTGQSVNIDFPRRIWYEKGDLGMQVKCSARGCRAGHFLNNRSEMLEELPSWRYNLSAVGIILLLFLCWMYFSYQKHNGRNLYHERSDQDLSSVMRSEDFYH